MKYFVLVIGVFLVAAGGQAIWSGYDIVQVERGWSSVIAGAVASAGGFVTIAVGCLIWRVDALRQAVLSLREPVGTAATVQVVETDEPDLAEPAPAPVSLPAQAAEAVNSFAIEPPPFVAAEEPPFEAILPPPVPPARIQPASNVASLSPRPERPPVRPMRVAPPIQAASVHAAVPVAPPLEEELRPLPAKRTEPADLAQRLRRVPLTKQQAIAHSRNPDLADVLGDQTRSARAAPPRSASLPVGSWPERPSIVAARRSLAAAAILPVEAVAKRAPEVSVQGPAEMHDWLERTLSGDDGEALPAGSQTNGIAAPPVELSDTPLHDDIDEKAGGVAADQSTGAEPVARYEARGTTYAMFADGSIEAETNSGRFRFASMDELRRFIEERQN